MLPQAEGEETVFTSLADKRPAPFAANVVRRCLSKGMNVLRWDVSRVVVIAHLAHQQLLGDVVAESDRIQDLLKGPYPPSWIAPSLPVSAVAVDSVLPIVARIWCVVFVAGECAAQRQTCEGMY